MSALRRVLAADPLAATEQIRHEADGSTRAVRQAHVEELIGTVQKVSRQGLEAGERFRPFLHSHVEPDDRKLFGHGKDHGRRVKIRLTVGNSYHLDFERCADAESADDCDGAGDVAFDLRLLSAPDRCLVLEVGALAAS